jgi:hypothetical protein
MLDKTKDGEVTEKDLGIGVQFTCTIGNGRQIAMTAGVPLDWDAGKLDKLLDKLGAAMERQGLKFELQEKKQLLEAAERQYATNLQQLDNYQQQQMAEWERRNKQGPYRPSESQVKQAQNFENNSQHLEKQIVKLRQDIKDAEERCR